MTLPSHCAATFGVAVTVPTNLRQAAAQGWANDRPQQSSH